MLNMTSFKGRQAPFRVYILPYIRPCPINNTAMPLYLPLNSTKSTLNPDLPYNRLPYKWYQLYHPRCSHLIVEAEDTELPPDYDRTHDILGAVESFAGLRDQIQ